MVVTYRTLCSGLVDRAADEVVSAKCVLRGADTGAIL